jgi:hypothetical protein
MKPIVVILVIVIVIIATGALWWLATEATLLATPIDFPFFQNLEKPLIPLKC